MTLSAHCHNSWAIVVVAEVVAVAVAVSVGGIIYIAATLETNRCIQRPHN